MPLYKYVKSAPKRKKIAQSISHQKRIISTLLVFSGFVLLSWTLWPIFAFIFSVNIFATTIKSPIELSTPGTGTKKLEISDVVLAVETQANQMTDYSNADVWFPSAPQKRITTPINSYTVSVPRLDIVNATTIIGATDLSKSLIHYGGTGLPGQYGTAVIFGHSTLPQFFSATNYRTIFSLLPTLKVGEDFFVTYDQVTYKYKIESMVVKDATDLSSLEQRYDDSYVTLVTCVPPGTYWKRLYVTGRLIRPE